jgi:hypothetical protein
MIHYLPVFLPQEDDEEKYDALKGVNLRFLRGNYREQSRVLPFLFLVRNTTDMDRKVNVLKEKFICHLGIQLIEDNCVAHINADTEFMLLAPLKLGRSTRENIFTIFGQEINEADEEVKLPEEPKNVIEMYKNEFGCSPSSSQMLAYFAADIAIKTHIDAGPSYHTMRHYLTHSEFECSPLGKLSFTEERHTCLIGKTWKEFVARRQHAAATPGS